MQKQMNITFIFKINAHTFAENSPKISKNRDHNIDPSFATELVTRLMLVQV
jgi:hypothetical protein